MNNILSKLKLNKKIAIILIVVMALALPFVINQVLQQQDIRQRADSAPAVTFRLAAPAPARVGDTVSVKVFLNSNTNDIGSFHFEQEGAEKFSDLIIEPSSPFTAIVQKVIPYGAAFRYSFTAVNTSENPITGSDVEIATIKFKATTPGSFMIRLKAIEVTAGRYDTLVPLSTTTAPSVGVQILDGSTPTPAVSSTPSPTSAVTPSPTQASAVTPSPTSGTSIIGSCPAGRPAKADGNANCDTVIDYLDYNIWKREVTGESQEKKSDFNNSTTVDTGDYQIWYDHFPR